MRTCLALVQSALSLPTTFSKIEGRATQLVRLPLSNDHDTTCLSYKVPRNQAQSRGYNEDGYSPFLKRPSELISLCQMPYVLQQHGQKSKPPGYLLSFIDFSTPTDRNQSSTPSQPNPYTMGFGM